MRTSSELEMDWSTVWEALRVHHVLQCFSTFYSASCHPPRGQADGPLVYGGLSLARLLPHIGSEVRATFERGAFFYSDEQGGEIGVIWDERGVVGLVLEKDSARNEAGQGRVPPEEYRPFRWLEGLPRQLEQLGRPLASLMQNLATAGFWAERGAPVWCSSGELIDTHDWFGLLAGARGPLLDLGQHGLDPRRGELAFKLATSSLDRPRAVTDEERETIVSPPAEWEGFDLVPQTLVALHYALAEIDVVLPI